MTKVIAIINHKGGTGKTTTTVNLAVGLKRKGKRVLVIDLDPQGSLSFHFGVNGSALGIGNVLLNETQVSEVIQEKEGVKLMPANSSLSDVELTIGHLQDRHLFLKNVIEDIKGRFDYVLIDCSPSISMLTINALTAADWALIPVKLEHLSLEGVKLVVKTIDRIHSAFNPTLKIVGIVPVMYDSSKSLLGKSKTRKENDHVWELFKNEVSVPILKSFISNDVAAMKAPASGSSVFKFAPKSKVVKEFELLVQEILAMK